MQLTWFLGMQMLVTFVLKCGECRLRKQQCNVMESCTIFITFFPYFVILIWFFWKTQIDCPFERGDNSCNLILSFANLSGNSLRVYVLCGLVTWPFGSDGNGIVWFLINPLKSQVLSPPPLFLFKDMDEWEILICPYARLRLMRDALHCPSVRLWGTNRCLSSLECPESNFECLELKFNISLLRQFQF